jgi:hypothetical protein
MSRRLLALGALAVLVALAGCSGVFGPPATDEAALAENESYDWAEEANASFDLTKSSYAVVYRIDNRTELTVYDRDALGQERSIPISALRFRYRNGTIVGPNTSSLTAERGGGRTTIDLPGNVSGQIAYRTARQGKSFGVPTHVEGAYAITLPPNARVGLPILAQVSPGGFETRGPVDDRVRVRWEDVEADQVRVRWYLQRDLVIFSALLAGAFVIGSGGAVFFYRQIKRLRARREEVGLDVDVEDDDPRDRGPPPGMP